MVWITLILASVILMLVSFRYYNLLLSFVAMLFWIATWAFHLTTRPANITQGSFVDEVLTYSFIIMAIVTMLVYFRPRGKDTRNIILGNANKEDSDSSENLPRLPNSGMMELSNDEYRAMMRKKLRATRK